MNEIIKSIIQKTVLSYHWRQRNITVNNSTTQVIFLSGANVEKQFIF